MRRIFAGGLAAVAATMLSGLTASASYFCEDEPPVTIVTPAGHHVTVNNFLTTERAYAHLLKRVAVTGYAEPAGEGRSLLHIYVFLPKGGASHVHVTSRTQRFETQTERDGVWGEIIELEMTVPLG